jgi:uncharacterized peroxidase-related enzyme
LRGERSEFKYRYESIRRRLSMAHIDLPPGLPGILGPMALSPETARPMNELVEVLLRGENTLTSAERELIATHVSYRNGCFFCHSSHGAAAAHHLEGDTQLVDDVKCDVESAEVSDKLKALLAIAGKVQEGGRSVTDEDVALARERGATDKEIHDTVLIAASFCMFNRYVDGLATWAPEEPEAYEISGKLLAEEGYVAAGKRLTRVLERTV